MSTGGSLEGAGSVQEVERGGDQTESGVDQPSEDFLYVDDNGEVIDPCEEASYLMAMELGSEMVEAPSGEWYTVAAAELADYQQRTAAAEAEAEAKAVAVKEGAVPSQEEAYEEGVEEGFEEEGPWTRAASTMSADEWVPERIVGERTRGGVKSYKVKWRWYDEMTWEPYEWLFEEGHGPLVEAYLGHTSKRQPHTSKTTKKRKAKDHWPPYTPEWYFRGTHLEHIQTAFGNVGLIAKRVAPCYTDDRMESFLRAVDAGLAPVLVYHGTRKANLRSIIQRGLAVPGTHGVRVVNGSAYGVGIYTARSPGLPQGYARDSNLILVCLGLVGPQFHTVTNGDVCVFSNANYVVPAWLVEYSDVAKASPPTECSVLDLLGPEPEGDGIVGAPPALVTGRTVVAPPAAHAPFEIPATAKDTAPRTIDGRRVPRVFRTLSKKEIRQAPRYVKDAYSEGILHAKPQ